MNRAHLHSTLFARVQQTRAEPEVKSPKTCELFNAGVNEIGGSAKSADPSCYDVPSSTMERTMQRMTGEQLQEARRAAAERFTAIAMQYVPEGYTVEYRKSLSGRHFGTSKRIQAPRPVTRKSLYIFLHECAHAQLGHAHNGRTPRHVEEMQAEKWAHEKMRENGVAVPRSMTVRAKQYVARKIRQAKRRGAKHIDREAARYAQ